MRSQKPSDGRAGGLPAVNLLVTEQVKQDQVWQPVVTPQRPWHDVMEMQLLPIEEWLSTHWAHMVLPRSHILPPGRMILGFRLVPARPVGPEGGVVR